LDKKGAFQLTAVVLFCSLLILILLSVPIGISIGVSTLITIIFSSNNIPLSTMTQKAFTALDSFPLMAIPFFTLAGILMGKGGVSKRLLDFAEALIGFIVGGLSMVTVLACMFFSAISGSGPATVAAIGSFMIPAMKERKYGLGFASALTATAGSLGVIIPPSIPFVLLGVTGSISISSLFLAGVFPGLMLGILLMVASYFIIKRKKIEMDSTNNKKINIRNVCKTFYRAKWALLTPVIVLGGIYLGIFTPTEAAAIATLYAFIVGAFIHRELRWAEIYDSLVETIKITGATFYLIGFSLVFAYILTIEKIPTTIAEAMVTITDNPFLILLLINIFLLIVGAFIDTIPAIVVLTPILLPVATQIGVDPIHFGVIMVLNLAIGFITPPMGINLFVASAVGNVSIEKIVKASLPLFLVMIVGLILVTYIPSLSLFLPNLFIE
jgi:C4-dicarboxylate transporter, DctM subunit